MSLLFPLLISLLYFKISSIVIDSPSSIAGVYPHRTQLIGLQEYNVNGIVKLSVVENACDYPIGNLTGYIAFILQGNCTLDMQVNNVINNGAIGIVVGNFIISDIKLPYYENIPNNPNITIPVVTMSARYFIKFTEILYTSSEILSVTLNSDGESGWDLDISSYDNFKSIFYAILLIPCIWIFLLLGYWLYKRYTDYNVQQSRERRNINLPVYVYSELNQNNNIDDNDSYLNSSFSNTLLSPFRSPNRNINPRIHNQECCICLESFLPDSRLKVFPCSHGFHVECIDPWILNNDACPACRTVIAE